MPLVCLSQSGILQPSIVFRFITVVQSGLRNGITPLVQSHQFRLKPDKLCSHRTAIFHFCFTGLCFFGLNQNYTTGCLTTINGCGSIFQKVDRLNIRRIQLAEWFRFDPVDNHQRIGIVLREWTAQLHVPAFIARSCRSTGNHHTRHLSLQRLCRTGKSAFVFQHLIIDHRNGTCQCFFFLRAVTNNYYFCQYLRVLTHYNLLKSFCVRSRNFYCLVTDIRNYHNCTRRRNIQCKITVDVRYHSIGSTFFKYAGSNYRFACCVNHQSFHRTGLHDGLYSRSSGKSRLWRTRQQRGSQHNRKEKFSRWKFQEIIFHTFII